MLTDAAHTVDAVLAAAPQRSDEIAVIARTDLTTNAQDRRNPHSFHHAAPMIVGAILQSGKAAQVGAGLAFEHDQTAIGEDSRFQASKTRLCPNATAAS